MRTEADVRYAGFVVLFFFVTLALAQMRPAVPITPEQAMRARVRAFTPTDYRIALLLRECVETGRMTFGAARDYLLTQESTIRDLANAQAGDR